MSNRLAAIYRIRTSLPLLLLLAIGCSAFASSSNDLIVEHGPRSSYSVALTFDLCPTSLEDEFDNSLIDVLIREKVPATLFISGRWVEKNFENARFLAGYPQFEIANHSFYHPHMVEKSDERIKKELTRTQSLIKKATGKTPRYFRPPFGEVDERVAKLAAEVELTTIQYDLESGDPSPKLDGKTIVRRILKRAKGGSIVVFHANRKGVHTAEVMPEIIEGLRKKGFKLVTVGELFGN